LAAATSPNNPPHRCPRRKLCRRRSKFSFDSCRSDWARENWSLQIPATNQIFDIFGSAEKTKTQDEQNVLLCSGNCVHSTNILFSSGTGGPSIPLTDHHFLIPSPTWLDEIQTNSKEKAKGGKSDMEVNSRNKITTEIQKEESQN